MKGGIDVRHVGPSRVLIEFDPYELGVLPEDIPGRVASSFDSTNEGGDDGR